MPLNQALVGRRYQEVSCPVTREHVERFAEAIGERSPIFRDADAARAAGCADQVAPPTFVTHPGGGVFGASGRSVARTVLADRSPSLLSRAVEKVRRG